MNAASTISEYFSTPTEIVATVMISSRRISTLIKNQFALLLSRNFTNHRQYSFNNIISLKILETINPTQTYRLTSIADTQLRYVSTSCNLLAQTEAMKGEGDHGLNLDYDDLLKAQKDETVLIVDVREDAEIKETGKLPGSIHVPMGQVADVLKNFPDDEFLKKFEKPKPTKDTKIIFSCRSGKRSAMVQEEMLKLGYARSYNYTGGWIDWESKQTAKA